jgi:hypothetical protein
VPERTPPNVPDRTGDPGYDAPHMNGAATPESTGTPTLRRRLMVGGLILFAAAWTVALIYSVTAGGRSPERLDDPTATVVATACIDAQRALTALPQVGGSEASNPALATRVSSEDAIFTKMITDLRALRPKGKAPVIALTGWLGDWQSLVTARERFVSDIHTQGAAARFVEPATQGIKPIADKMNNWTLEQGTRTDACNTGALQVEQIYGLRKYGAESKS